MRFKKNILFFLLCFCSISIVAKAQNTDSIILPRYKVAIFSPLYLDSVFSGNSYLHGKNFPAFLSPGLDFTLGAQLGLKNLNITNAIIDAQIMDSKFPGIIDSLIANQILNSYSLMICSVKDDEFVKLAKFSKEKNIPLISATYPNDGGITDNPNLFIINSTLKAHCEGIFSYMLQNHQQDNIIFVRKKGTQEDRIAGYLNNINKPDQNTLLQYKSVKIDSSFSPLVSQLDSSRKNVILGGSLDEKFGINLISKLNEVKSKYDIVLFGMPNWDGFKAGKNDFAFNYTTPYHNDKKSSFNQIIQNDYKSKYKRNPSDFTYKGFEVVYNFVNLLAKYQNSFIQNINDKTFNVFSEYNFLPVYGNNKAIPNYYENKHLYFLKKENGAVNKMQ
ncbi:MAG: hypothetical protein FGM46_05110 [Ferruginibacter sp.]|nr:hypothetical protein [Ferruginibacter sp.]